MVDVDFRPHDIRRTACSEVDAAWRGMGKVLLLHSPMNVTEASYLNALPEKWEAFVRVNYAYGEGFDVVDKLVDEYAEEHNVQNPPLT